MDDTEKYGNIHSAIDYIASNLDYLQVEEVYFYCI